MEFNTQICTSVEQSKRLLDLGLKPETADCFHWNCSGTNYIGNIDEDYLSEVDVPAWSLHRLIVLLNPQTVEFVMSTVYGAYEDVIYNISISIKNGTFNKEYLKQ